MLITIREIFASFSERAKLFIVVFILSILAVLLSLVIGGLPSTLLLIVPSILAILQVTKGIWTPEGGGKSKIGLASLGIAFAAVVSNQQWTPLVNSLSKPLFELFPSLQGRLPADSLSITALIFLGAVILIVNYFSRDQTAMKEHPTPIEKEFPEKDYKKVLKSFCRVLLNDLDRIDRETNWSAEIFTPLDAEVEVQSGTRRLKKITDLLTAIRSDRQSQVFLILGEPGSGKSVALRKLSRDLLNEVEVTGKVPLYINLREWETSQTWTPSNPPTVRHLYDFVLNNLKNRTDIFANEFLDKYFKPMFDNGRLFIVLDSFDEIPAVLDVNESSWLIDELSATIYKFLAGAHESRGVLASRIFRRPTEKFAATTKLNIRPFTERKIVENLRKSLFYDERLLKLLFNERTEFLSIARNPFLAALILSYAKNHNYVLPANQEELYSSYITQRLEMSAGRLRDRGIAQQDIIECSVDIADITFSTETLGLEAPIRILQQKLPQYPINNIIDILVFARLGRLGGGQEQRFSFVHRRFNEYFVVQKLKRNHEHISYESIPTDSRWRDALVLYCEVAEEAKAKEIAEFCWLEIKSGEKFNGNFQHVQHLRAIHCLRFLKEAFRSRLDCTESFRSELGNYIKNNVENSEDLLTRKLALEAVGLLRADDINSIIISALRLKNQWIDETALRACNYLTNATDELRKNLVIFLEGIDIIDFIRRKNEIIFSLRLSNIFADIRNFCLWRTIDGHCMCIGILGLIIIKPILVIPLMISLQIFRWISNSLKNVTRRISPLLARWAILWFIFIAYIIAIGIEIIARDYTTAFIGFRELSSYRAWLYLPMLFVMPWYQLYYYGDEIKNSVKRVNGKTILWVFSSIVGIGLFIGAMILLAERFPTVSIISLIIIYGFGGLMFLFTVSKGFYERWRDYKRLVALRGRPPQTRENIAEQFLQFETPKFRLEYVKFLEQQGVNPEGFWPEGKPPNINNDGGSTELAKLEEKWLGFDR